MKEFRSVQFTCLIFLFLFLEWIFRSNFSVVNMMIRPKVGKMRCPAVTLDSTFWKIATLLWFRLCYAVARTSLPGKYHTHKMQKVSLQWHDRVAVMPYITADSEANEMNSWFLYFVAFIDLSISWWTIINPR